MVNGNSDVSLDLELQFRALQGQSINGVPVISNREYKGSIVSDGWRAGGGGRGSLELRTAQPEWNSWPGSGAGPESGDDQQQQENDEDELLIVITPRVVSHEQNQNAEVWMQK